MIKGWPLLTPPCWLMWCRTVKILTWLPSDIITWWVNSDLNTQSNINIAHCRRCQWTQFVAISWSNDNPPILHWTFQPLYIRRADYENSFRITVPWAEKLPRGFAAQRIIDEKLFVWNVGGNHDDVIKWKHFPRYWPFVRGIQRSLVNSPQKGQWRGALMLSLICTLNRRLSKQ